MQPTDPPRYVDPCGTCPEDVDQTSSPADGEVLVLATPIAGATWPTWVCAQHLPVEVTWARRLGQDVTVRVPREVAA